MAKLERALAQLAAEPARGGPVHPRLQMAQEEALRSQIADLHALRIESNGFCLLKQAGRTKEDRGRES